MRRTTASSDLDNYTGGISTNDELITEAEALAQQIEDAFHAHTMDRAPAWVEQQRRGVLNVGRYMTRQPGDTEFFRASGPRTTSRASTSPSRCCSTTAAR